MSVTTWVGFYFIVDAAACFPVALLSLTIPAVTVGDAGSVKLLRTLKVFRLVRLVRLRRTMATFSVMVMHNPSFFRLAKLLLLLVFGWHVVACLFFGMLDSHMGDVCAYCAEYVSLDPSGAYQQCTYNPAPLGGAPEYYNATMSMESWRSQPEDLFRCGLFADTQLSTRYSQSYFWAVMVTFGVGRDIVPQSNSEVRSTLLPSPPAHTHTTTVSTHGCYIQWCRIFLSARTHKHTHHHSQHTRLLYT